MAVAHPLNGSKSVFLIEEEKMAYVPHKGSDWIRLEFAHPFPLNSGAAIVSANGVASSSV